MRPGAGAKFRRGSSALMRHSMAWPEGLSCSWVTLSGSPAADLAEDLEADSLDAVELNMAIEEALGVSIPDEELKNVKTVGDIVRYLEAHQE